MGRSPWPRSACATGPVRPRSRSGTRSRAARVRPSTCPSSRLRLAFRFTPGAAHGPSHQVGEFYYGQLDGAIDYYECPVEPSPANVTALLATDFSWTPAAAGLVAPYRTDPAAVARVRADVDAAHRENVERVRRCMERVWAGDMSAEVLRELREASEGLDG